jgi:hypothetical protein
MPDADTYLEGADQKTLAGAACEPLKPVSVSFSVLHGIHRITQTTETEATH